MDKEVTGHCDNKGKNMECLRLLLIFVVYTKGGPA